MDKKQKILIVDDAKFNRDILKEILGDAYNYLEAENGNQAIHVIAALAREMQHLKVKARSSESR